MNLKALLISTLAVLAMTGCSASDYAREEALPFVAISADEARAELRINGFISAANDRDFDAACRDYLTVRLQLLFAAELGSCEKGFQEVSDAGGSTQEVTVLGSDRTKEGLWIRTDNGRFLMQGDRIAYFEQ